ncbi:RNA-binding protein RO60-like [Lineus longissimus]|uniref:RNA-binding protein RO60-like n=1 Tax=Lineus longissimus TaxID=88925 RepID=UPI002B4C6973
MAGISNNVPDVCPIRQMDDITRLHRFLCMGAECGTYYPGERPLMKDHADCIARLITEGHGEFVVKEILRFSSQELSIKERPVIFALALCARNDDPADKKDHKTKMAAYAALADICRLPPQLFAFVDFAQANSGKTTGWGRAQRKALNNWYRKKTPRDLAVLVTKYIQRGGWTHVDIFRLAHVKPVNEAMTAIMKFAVKGLDAVKKDYEKDGLSDDMKCILRFLEAVHTVKHSNDEHQIARLIEEYHLTPEYVPTQFSKSQEIWYALLHELPVKDMIRLLGRMSAIGLLEPLSNPAKLVIDKLSSEQTIQSEKIHPIEFLIAMKIYEGGKGDKGKVKWFPNGNVIDALNRAFLNSYKFIQPTNSRYLLAVDVSGSMAYGNVNGCQGVSPAVAAAAMAMLIARTEKEYQMVAFSTGITPVQLNAQMDLLHVCKIIAELPSGGTDCAIPILWAMENKRAVDVFMVITDCETLSAGIPPSDALKKYRQLMGLPNTRMVVCALTSNGFTLADPSENGMLDIAGFDAGVPLLINNFVKGII